MRFPRLTRGGYQIVIISAYTHRNQASLSWPDDFAYHRGQDPQATGHIPAHRVPHRADVPGIEVMQPLHPNQRSA